MEEPILSVRIAFQPSLVFSKIHAQYVIANKECNATRMRM